MSRFPRIARPLPVALLRRGPSAAADPDPGPGPDPEPSGAAYLYPSVLQPSQNMVRLDAGQYGIADPLCSPADAAGGIVYWYRRGRSDGDRDYYICLERGLGATTENWVFALEIARSTNAVPFAANFRTGVLGDLTPSKVSSSVPVSDVALSLIVAYWTATEIGVSVDGSPFATAAYTAASPLPAAHSLVIGDRHNGAGPYARDTDRQARGDHFSLSKYLPGTPGAVTFDADDVAALLAAGPRAYEDVPTLADATLAKFYKFDGPKVIEQVGGTDVVSFYGGPTLVASPADGSSGCPAFPGSRVRSFGLGPRQFTFAHDESAVIEEAPRRVDLTATTRARRSAPAFLGHESVALGMQVYLPIPAPGVEGDADLLTDLRPDGSSFGVELVEGRFHAVRARDTSGDVVAEVVAADTPYHEVTITAVTKSEIVTEYRTMVRTRLMMTVSGTAGHRIAPGDTAWFTDAGWSGSSYTIVWVSDDNTGIEVIRYNHGHPLPAVGSKLYLTGQEFRASNTSSSSSGWDLDGRFIHLGTEIDGDGSIRLYAGGVLLQSGSIDPSLLGNPTGAVCWLNGRSPGLGKGYSLTLLGEHHGATAPQRRAVALTCGELVDGRDGYLDDTVYWKSAESVVLDRVRAVDHLYECHLVNADGSDHIPTINPDTNQSWSRPTGPMFARRIGSPDIVETTVITAFRAVWPKLLTRGGLFVAGRTGAPEVVPIELTRYPLGALERQLRLDKDHAEADDDPDNLGTDPGRPLLSLNGAVDRAIAYDRVIATPGRVYNGDLDNRGTAGTDGSQAPGRVRFEAGTTEGGGTVQVRDIKLAGAVRNYLRGIYPRDTTSGPNDVLSISGTGITGVHFGLTIADCEAYSNAPGTLIGSNNFWGKNVLFENVRPRNEKTSNTDAYLVFLGGCDGFHWLGGDLEARVEGSGSHPMRIMGITNSSFEHLGKINWTTGELGNRPTMSLRGNVWRIYVSDWGDQTPARNFIVLDVPPEIQSRGDFAIERTGGVAELGIWIARSVRIAHTRVHLTASASEAIPEDSELISSPLAAFGVRCSNTNDALWGENTEGRQVPSTGHYRSVSTTSGDYGPVTAPPIGAVHDLGGGRVYIMADGLPQANTATFRRLGWQRKLALELDAAAVDLPGRGATHTSDRVPGPGTYVWRTVLHGGLAFGPWSDTVTVTA